MVFVYQTAGKSAFIRFLCIFFPPAIFTLVYYTFSFTFRDRFDQYVPFIVQVSNLTICGS